MWGFVSQLYDFYYLTIFRPFYDATSGYTYVEDWFINSNTPFLYYEILCKIFTIISLLFIVFSFVYLTYKLVMFVIRRFLNV